MSELWLWGLVASFFLLAVGTTLKAVESAHAKKLSDDEVSRLRAELDMLNHQTINEVIDVEPADTDERPVEQIEGLEKIREDILVLLASHPDSQAEFCAQTIKVGNQVALHHLEAMQQKNLVSYCWRNEEWKLQPLGREYLVRHNLVS